MNTIQPFQAAVGSNCPYTLDWHTAGKLQTGETISTSSWAESTATLTLSSASHTTTTSTVFAAGGIDGEVYDIFNTVTTNLGRTDIWGFRLHFAHILESA